MADNDRTTFVLADVIAELQSAGFNNAHRSRINYLIAHGHLPRPKKDGAGRFIFERWHIERIAVLLGDLPSAQQPADLTDQQLDGGDFSQFSAMH